jgi:hypothetical protein
LPSARTCGSGRWFSDGRQADLPMSASRTKKAAEIASNREKPQYDVASP